MSATETLVNYLGKALAYIFIEKWIMDVRDEAHCNPTRRVRQLACPDCPIGQVQIISELTLILSHMLQTSKIILISYKPSTYSNFFNLTHVCFVIWASLGKLFYGQACLTGQPRKKKIVAAYQPE